MSPTSSLILHAMSNVATLKEGRQITAYVPPGVHMYRVAIAAHMLLSGFACTFRTSPHLDRNTARHEMNRAENLPIISTAPISFGTLAPGQHANTMIHLENHLSIPVTICSYQTTCPCLRLLNSPITIQPHQTQSLPLEFVPHGDDRDFRGTLSVGISGLDSRGTQVFLTTAAIRIQN